MPDTRITREDIDREREILEENAGEHPALEELLEELPSDYDPQKLSDDS